MARVARGADALSARRFAVEGLVQGVGFRPFVQGLARRLDLRGWVRNTAFGVEIVAEGPAAALDALTVALRAEAPPLAQVRAVTAGPVEPAGFRGFTIEPSVAGAGRLPVPVDVATCADCLREARDPGDRRFGYAFVNCTNCGPRYTILHGLPYDRERTAMRGFALCAACAREYADPADRRFHAEPIACPACGPQVRFPGGLAEARRQLARGRIVALKGVGGFQLACDARNEAAVARLRARKRRPAKPFAVMTAGVAAAERIAHVSAAEAAALLGPAAPIVLLARRADADLAPSVAPGLRETGVMLPASALHALLFDGAPFDALVMTSGNRTNEPIAIDDAHAAAAFGDIADAVLTHDRPIAARADDAVVRVYAGAELPLRRARGAAPLPLRLPFPAPPLLAAGADLKNAFAFAVGRDAYLGPHLGDLANADVASAYAASLAHLAELLQIEPEVVVHDLYPQAFAPGLARAFAPRARTLGVQHHHAHVAAVLADRGVEGPAIAFAFDGTGYGTDGAIWGGECFVATVARAERVLHLAYVALPGGDAAIRRPARLALAHLAHAGVAWNDRLPAVASFDALELNAVARQLASGLNAPPSSSMGRWFDAIAALAGICSEATYDGQAAMELQSAAACGAAEPYPFALLPGAPAIVDPGPATAAIARDLLAGAKSDVVAARFQATVVAIVVAGAGHVRAARGLDRVALSGGVFQNADVLASCEAQLTAAGFAVFSHRRVPTNDGGIAFGQAAVAAARAVEGV